MLAERYEKIKVIGKGAFGEAVLVKSLADGELYVSKEIDLSKLSRKDREAADTEIQVLQTVDHPNITRFVDSFQDRNLLYIIMEYADGGDLHAKIKRQQQAGLRGGGLPLPEHLIRNWFVQLCLALQHLHSKKILHRDLKTRNVFMTASGQIKLGDFGLATVLNHSLAQAQTLCGTPYYFSPELCKNKPYNNKSDVWALGCILYETCTLKHAFDDKSMKGLMQKILRGIYPPISPAYSQDLHNLIRMMLCKTEAERPSVTQILEMDFMQLSLKMLYHNITRRTEEEDEAPGVARLQEAAAANIRGDFPAAVRATKEAPTAAKQARQQEEFEKIATTDRAALKKFLSGPPPDELAGRKKEEPEATPTPPAPTGAAPEPAASTEVPAPCGPTPEELAATKPDQAHYTSMKLGGAQFKTLAVQMEQLTCVEGGRSLAAAEDAPVVDAPAPTQPTEELRRVLEQALGVERFEQAYNILKNMQEGDNEEDVIQRVDAILGARRELKAGITQLIESEP